MGHVHRMCLFVDLWGQQLGVRDEGCKVPRSSERVGNNAISSRGRFFLKRFKIDVYITDIYFVCFHNVHVHVWIYECVQNKII